MNDFHKFVIKFVVYFIIFIIAVSEFFDFLRNLFEHPFTHLNFSVKLAEKEIIMYILITILSLGYGQKSVYFTEFSSKETCQKAADSVKQLEKDSSSVCVPK